MEKTSDQAYASKAQKMTTVGMMTAVTCILAPFSIPIPVSPVPITLTNLVILVGVYLLGGKLSTLSYLLYLLLGLVGLPVFSGFSGGVGKLLGPTGGYLIGMLFLAFLSGSVVERFPQNRLLILCSMGLGMAITYLFGTVWLAFQMSLHFWEALSIGVLPYLPGDGAKIVLAVLIGPLLRSRINKIQSF